MWPAPVDQSYMHESEHPRIHGWVFIRRWPMRQRVYFESEGIQYYSDSSCDAFFAGKTFQEASAAFKSYFHMDRPDVRDPSTIPNR